MYRGAHATPAASSASCLPSSLEAVILNRFYDIAQIVDGPRAPDEPPKDPPGGGVPGAGDVPPGDASIEIVPGELARMCREAEAQLAQEPPILFQRGHKIVRPDEVEVDFANGNKGYVPSLHIQTAHGVYRALAERTRWKKYDGRKRRLMSCDPPDKISLMIANGQGQWRLPQISGVTSCPTLRPDGSLLYAPGYDQATGIFNFWTLGDLGIPSRPSRSDAEEGLSDLQHLISEVPFVSDVDRAVILSGLISPVVRGAMSVCPLHAITSPSPGSGKSFLVDLCAMVATGRRCPVQHASLDEVETEKRIVAAVLGGYSIVSLDNANHEIKSDLLCQALERPLIQLRALGSSAISEVENRACFYATGNGFCVSGDLVRRTLLCRIDPKMERPETRRFDLNPLTTVERDRKRYVRSALIIVRAFLDSGETLDLVPIGSFEDWTRTVRSALVWLGVPDPADAIQTSRENDSALLALCSILTFLVDVFGGAPFSVADVINVNSSAGLDEPDKQASKYRAEFREIILSVAGVRGKMNGRRLSTWFDRNTGRFVGGARIERDEPDKHTKARRWKVV